jgi:hypothetical protein
MVFGTNKTTSCRARQDIRMDDMNMVLPLARGKASRVGKNHDGELLLGTVTKKVQVQGDRTLVTEQIL